MTCACVPRPLTAVLIAVANLAALFLAADAKNITETENVKLTEKKSSHGLKESFKSCFIVCEWTRFSVKKSRTCYLVFDIYSVQ